MSGIRGQSQARTETRNRQAARQEAGEDEENRESVWMPDIVVTGSGLASSWDIGSQRRMERFIGF